MTEVRFHSKVRGISAAFVRRAVQAALQSEKVAKKPMSVYVTTNADIREINRRFLKHDYATDVISFDTGDIVISSEFAKAYSNSHSIPFKEEVARYLVHGTLHLLGYDDRKPADYKKMHARQERILKKAGFIK